MITSSLLRVEGNQVIAANWTVYMKFDTEQEAHEFLASKEELEDMPRIERLRHLSVVSKMETP